MDLGPSEVLVILVVVMLLFGAKRLPDIARGSGRALRIFKAEISATDNPTGEKTEPADAKQPPTAPPDQPGSRTE